MPTTSTPFTILVGVLPSAARLSLLRLLQEQPGVRAVAVGAAELPAQARRLRPGLLIVGQQQLRDIEQLSRTLTVPTVLYAEAPPLPGMLREAARWGVFDVLLAESGSARWLQQLRTVLPQAPVGRPAGRTMAVPGLTRGVVVIGGSTGATAAVERLVRQLPTTLACALVVAVHLPATFFESFVARLQRATLLPVLAGWPGTVLEPGRIVVAPGGRNLLVRAATRGPWPVLQTEATTEASLSGDEPSVDVLMCSVARTVGRNVLGVVLTGLGRDGTLGAQAIRQCGGTVLVQDEATSAVFSMPKSVIQSGWANAVLPLDELPAAIVRQATEFRRLASAVRPFSAHAVQL